MEWIRRLVPATILVLFSLPALASAGTWYVSPDGNDVTGNGSSATPFKTIGRAVSAAADGDSIRVLPGLYRECVNAAGKALSFVATAIEADTPSMLVTIVDGTGICGGSSCSERKSVACYGSGEENCLGYCNNLVCSVTTTQHCLLDSDCPSGERCTGTTTTGICTNDESVSCTRNLCLVPQGEEYGTCQNHPSVECYYDSECADLDCHFGECNRIEGRCSVAGNWCTVAADCPEGQSCDTMMLAPAFNLWDGSSVKGFTIYGGGLSGVRLAGPGSIVSNRIDYNRATEGDGGGIYLALPSAPPPRTCWGNSLVACVDDAGCSVCHDDTSALCSTDQDCMDAGAGTACDEVGPCLATTEVVLDDNLIRNNVADASGAGHGGGAVFMRVFPAEGAGVRLVANGNDMSSNSTAGDGGALVALASGEGRFHVRLEDNVVGSNQARDGGGVAVRATLLGTAARADVELVGNTIQQNEAASEGGGALAELAIAGTGQVLLSANDVLGNEAAGDGGGVLVRLAGDGAGARGIEATGNQVSGNVAGGSGAGLDLTLSDGASTTEAGEITATGNVINGNSATVGGGGLRASAGTTGTVAATKITVDSNSVRDNTAASYGAGVVLSADAEGSAGVSVSFDHNLVAENSATNETSLDATGGGLFFYLRGAGGEASASVSYATIASNHSDDGAAAIEIESDGTPPTGTARITVTNSILADNDGVGIGGPSPEHEGKLMAAGSRDLRVTVSYTDVWGNTGVGYERTLAGEIFRDGTDISEDPGLVNDFTLELCSPAIDAADPAAAFALEPEPNGLRANLGHLGGTAGATPTVPDLDADRHVDGIDLLRLASTFGVNRLVAPERFYSPADLDGNGEVDGIDLAFLAAFFGFTCP